MQSSTFWAGCRSSDVLLDHWLHGTPLELLSAHRCAAVNSRNALQADQRRGSPTDCYREVYRKVQQNESMERTERISHAQPSQHTLCAVRAHSVKSRRYIVDLSIWSIILDFRLFTELYAKI